MCLVAALKVEGKKKYPLTFLSLVIKPAYDSLFFSTGTQVFIFHSSPSVDHPTITLVCRSDSAGWRALVQHVCAGRGQSDNDRSVPGRFSFSVGYSFPLILFTILLITYVYKNTFMYMYTHTFWWWNFFSLKEKHNSWNLFSLNRSEAQVSVLRRWWSGWMNLCSSNDLLH